MTATTVRERPIIFSSDMVRAILDGRKTQTRRVVSVRHADGIETGPDGLFSFMHSPKCGGGCDYACASSGEIYGGHIGWTPWGSNPRAWGRLWVRETWQRVITKPVSEKETWFSDTWSGVPAGRPRVKSIQNGLHSIVFRADGEMHYGSGERLTWASPLFMPRWASRITLEITEVRVQRLQDISEDDATSEGAKWSGDVQRIAGLGYENLNGSIAEFALKWDGINGKRPGCDWNANPWVWVLSFRKIDAACSGGAR